MTEDLTSSMFRQEPQKLPLPFGLNNPSGICWFNALIQAALTCTALIVEPLEIDKSVGSQLWHNLVARAGSGDDTLVQSAINELLSEFIRQFGAKTGLTMGPSCAAEAITYLIDFIGIGDRVKTAHRSTVQCDSCGNSTMSDRQYGNLVYVSAAVRPDEPPRLIYNENPCPGYRCEKCAAIGRCIRRETLCFISSVIIISITDRSGIVPTRILRFGSSAGTLLYRLVSVVLHDGGHYWTICLRKKNGISAAYLLNDSAVIPLESLEDTQLSRTYLAFYALIGRDNESPIRGGSNLYSA